MIINHLGQFCFIDSYFILNFIADAKELDRTDRKRKRRSRWAGTENDKAVFPGMPTILPSNIPPEKAEAYIGKRVPVWNALTY